MVYMWKHPRCKNTWMDGNGDIESCLGRARCLGGAL